MQNVPDNAKAGLLAMNAGKPLVCDDPKALAQSMLDRYEAGESVAEIGASLGVSDKTIYRHLMLHAESTWKEYQAAGALSELDNCETELKTAPNGLELKRAQELAKLQTWRLERVYRRVYGADQGQINVQINIGDVGLRIKDLEAELIATQHANPA